ncbi:MAG: zinc ribbon domain-containing protein [Candidatus Helarchaeota archaeon]
MSEKLNKIYSFKISENMLKDMRELSDEIGNWSKWIRRQIKNKIQELKIQSEKLKEIYCPNCASPVEKSDKFCASCGENLKI